MDQGLEHKPNEKTREQVYFMSAIGHSQESIAKHLDLHTDTLRKHYRNELDNANLDAEQKLGKTLFQKGFEDGDLGAMIFWLKTRTKGRWKEEKKEDNSVTVIEMLLNQLAEKNKTEK